MKLIRLTGILALLVGLLAPTASVSAASAAYVHPGQSIQAALDAAPAGGMVVVERGTYRANLDITRPVRLIGHGAIIVPAATPTQNSCLAGIPGMVMGICVYGGSNPDGTIARTISDVSIEGFTIRNFSGPGIVAAGVSNFRVVRNVIAHNGFWGIDVGVSSGVSLLYNTVYGNGGDGIRVDYSPAANATIVGNASYGNLGTGIMFLSALGGRIALNTMYDNCAGIVVAAVGDPTQSGAGNVSVVLNQVLANNRLCAAVPDQGSPAYGGIGITLIGTRDTLVALNDVRANVAQPGSSLSGGGILLLDGAMFGAPAPTGTSVRLNSLSGNAPNDIFGDSTGTGNTISGNSCTTWNVPGVC
jgi:nitrous oxidase accessory protein NosD